MRRSFTDQDRERFLNRSAKFVRPPFPWASLVAVLVYLGFVLGLGAVTAYVTAHFIAKYW